MALSAIAHAHRQVPRNVEGTDADLEAARDMFIDIADDKGCLDGEPKNLLMTFLSF